MSRLRLVFINDVSLTRSESGTVWGQIYFETANGFFPDEGWTDMALAFSTAWLGALIQIVLKSNAQETVWFMDGPFAVNLASAGSRLAELSFVHRETTKHSEKARIKDLLQNGVAVAEELLAACRQKGWPDTDRDLEALKITLREGAEILTRLTRRT
jgi:hypothetical protein